MKTWFATLLAVCLCFSLVASAESTPPKLTYEPFELDMPAVFLKIYVPNDLELMEGDEEGFDLGSRFFGSNAANTFSLSVDVHDSREMNLAAFADFYAKRSGYTTTAAEKINGYDAQRLTKTDNPKDFTILLAAPGVDDPMAIYSLWFICDGKADVALADEILGTLSPYGM